MGAGLAVLYTLLISGADGVTKFIAGGYAAPQLFAISGLIVVGLSLIAHRLNPNAQGLRTQCPKAMALRSGATVLAALCFFYAMRYLPFADVFIFVGVMPVLAGLMSGPMLGEYVRPMSWLALLLGVAGVVCLFPHGINSIGWGHGIALMGAFFGTVSIVLSRYISRVESNMIAQVLYPNLAIFVSMGLALPFVYQPMPLADWAAVFAYAVALFAARWVLVAALNMLTTYVVTPLLNLQFVWMVGIGVFYFGEVPPLATYIGAAIVVISGSLLLLDQLLAMRKTAKPAPSKGVRADWSESQRRSLPEARPISNRYEISRCRPYRGYINAAF